MEEVINLYKFSLINSSSAHPFLEPSKEFQIEDILQLKNGNILIDVGYYNSVLTIFVVYDYNWESPLIKREYQSWENMQKDLTTICLDFSM